MVHLLCKLYGINRHKNNMSYLQTFVFGITLAIAIDPIAILILNRSINCGFKNGALCGLDEWAELKQNMYL